jgi:sulfite oxidase
VTVVVPGYFSAPSVKLVQRITARAELWDGHLQAEDYCLLPPEVEPAPGRGIALRATVHDVCDPPQQTAAVWAATASNSSGTPWPATTVSSPSSNVFGHGWRTWVQAQVEDRPSPRVWQLWHITFDALDGTVEDRLGV